MAISLRNFIDYESVETDSNVSPIQNSILDIEFAALNTTQRLRESYELIEH